jgi:hypothetical protein
MTTEEQGARGGAGPHNEVGTHDETETPHSAVVAAAITRRYARAWDVLQHRQWVYVFFKTCLLAFLFLRFVAALSEWLAPGDFLTKLLNMVSGVILLPPVLAATSYYDGKPAAFFGCSGGGDDAVFVRATAAQLVHVTPTFAVRTAASVSSGSPSMRFPKKAMATPAPTAARSVMRFLRMPCASSPNRETGE